MKKEKLFKWKGLLFACMWIVSIGLFAQNITVTGTVTDANNEPVIGATVRVKGSSSGTVTDLDGNYSISLSTPPGRYCVYFHVCRVYNSRNPV